MATRSGIEWTEATWNPATGCSRISAGCRHCYAERMSKRLQGMGVAKYANGFRLTLHEDLLDLPLRWSTPQMVFVNSMSDLFHEEMPEGFIERVFVSMRRAWWHTFQVLTKRSQRLVELDSRIDWPANVWMGVSIQSEPYLQRLAHLKASRAKVKFLSLEPLLGPLPQLDLNGIDWVIVGGESGPGARPLAEEWVRAVRDMCEAQRVAFFFKQWGGQRKKEAGRLLDGRTWEEWPRGAHD